MFFYKVIFHINCILKKILLKIIYGKKIEFYKNVQFRRRFNVAIENNGRLIIGNNTFFNNDCSINVMNELTIGNNCLFGENVKIYDHNHIFKNENQLIRSQGYKSDKIRIGNNCWICSNVIILKGVTIGDNCVIGAGCIIKEDVDNNCIVQNINNIEIEKVIKE